MKREGGALAGIALIILAIVKWTAQEAPIIVRDLTPTAAHAIAAESASEFRIAVTILEPWVIRAGGMPGVDAALFETAQTSARQQAQRLDALVEEIRVIAANNGLTSESIPGRVRGILHSTACDAMSDLMAGKKLDAQDLLMKNGLVDFLGEPVESIVLASDTGQNMMTSLKNGNSASQSAYAARLSIECALAGRTG